MAFKEQVAFYPDESRTRPVFSFKARQGLDVRAEHDAIDEHGRPLGYTVTVSDPRLDFRVAASMAVALDALQGR